MAQISDVMHASAVFDAARQELAWAYSGTFTDVPEPMEDAVHAISAVLNDAEMRWVASTREEEPMAAVVDKENGAVVVATGHEEEEKKREVVGEKKIMDWFMRLEEVAWDMRAAARRELLGDYSRIDDKLSARWLPCLPRSTSRAARIAPTIDTVALELEKLKEQYHKEFGHSTGLPLAATGLKEQPACDQQAERETSVTGDVPMERDDDAKQSIINIINHDVNVNKDSRHRSDASATILPIFAPPCVGKTTLVKSVFHEAAGSFGAGYKVWVDMRKGQGIKEIHEAIIEVLGRHHFDGYYDEGKRYIREVWSEVHYGRYIHDMLEFNNTRLLLVLDNRVENQDLDTLNEMLDFKRNTRNLIAIMITRSEDWARYIALRSKTLEYRLHPCSDDMCWEIIKRTSGLDLEATAAGMTVAVSEMDGREIASKCSGIPLAAKALGCFLPFVDPQEWPGLIRDVWNIGGGFSRDSQQLRPLPIRTATVFRHLKRSRDVLGDESWLSLAYCAFVFPKGKSHGVLTRDLLNQWCSLGITTREGGASCISELLDRSLILGEGAPASETKDETEVATLLRMEDLIHDFARYLLGDRMIVVDGKNGATAPSTSSHANNKSSAYLALVSNFDAKRLDISSMLPAVILALRFEGCGEMELRDAAFATFADYLRLLDLSGYSVNKKLPDCIGHLKQLRYLKAPGVQDQVLPRSITGLHELRYLSLRGSCQLSDLTEAFQTLSNLLHLDLSGCSGLKALPNSFWRLWRLEHLDLSACSGLESLPDESFGWLRKLRHLDLAGCSALKAPPSSFERLAGVLRHLDLSGCSGLEALPSSMDRFVELQHLNLSELSGITQLPTSLSHKLVHLYLSGCSGLTDVTPIYRLRLQHLDLSGCCGLESLHEMSLVQWYDSLSHLDLTGCSGLKALPTNLNRLDGVLRLNLSGCSGLKALPDWGDSSNWCQQPKTWRLEHLDLSACSGLESLPDQLFCSLRWLRHLDLAGCSGLKALPNSFERLAAGVLRHLDLSRCSGLELLPSSMDRFIELRHLNLSELSGITQFPQRWPDKLVHLDLSGCSGLTDMAPICRLERLQHLDLSGCSRLPAVSSEGFLEGIRRNGGRASGPKDASLKCQL